MGGFLGYVQIKTIASVYEIIYWCSITYQAGRDLRCAFLKCKV